MKFKRKQDIISALEPKRVLVVYGPRRVGKTTMLNDYIKTQSEKRVYFSTGDDIELRKIIQSEKLKEILDFARPFEIIAIDEAQFIPSIGLGAKMMIDAFPEKNIILTGSSSLDLSNKIGEPLTGRHFTLTLLPLSQGEIMDGSRFELKTYLEDFLIYGSYPEVLNEPDIERKRKILTELVSSYLFKDALALEAVRSPDTLLDIAKCLAFQVGNEVSINEVARTAKTDAKTAAKYLDLLEKMFIIRRVRGFSRNLRNEISKKPKYYFLDNGVRNALISQFNPLSLRNDIGALWENFIFMELVKKTGIEEGYDNYYFWRTHTGQEIDIIKETNGSLTAIECKWSKEDAVLPSAWKKAYKNSTFQVIHKNNYLDFLI
ncbi:MAG: ATP-binding protein [Candidatus Taylorbacteria bacterium]|nr:ATP-binding protein [Candidatus Taylorbacteria bacterium]